MNALPESYTSDFNSLMTSVRGGFCCEQDIHNFFYSYELMGLDEPVGQVLLQNKRYALGILTGLREKMGELPEEA